MTCNDSDELSERESVPSLQEDIDLYAIGGETKIDTDLGIIPARDLTDKHRLRVLDGGFKSISWVERLDLDEAFLSKYPGLRPLRIPAGHFRADLPRRDVVLSQNTLIRVSDDRQGNGRFGAAHLFVSKQQAMAEADRPITYIVIGCVGPTMFRAEGMWVSC